MIRSAWLEAFTDGWKREDLWVEAAYIVVGPTFDRRYVVQI